MKKNIFSMNMNTGVEIFMVIIMTPMRLILLTPMRLKLMKQTGLFPLLKKKFNLLIKFLTNMMKIMMEK